MNKEHIKKLSFEELKKNIFEYLPDELQSIIQKRSFVPKLLLGILTENF